MTSHVMTSSCAKRLLAIAWIALATLAAGCNREAPKPPPAPTPEVTVLKVTPQDVDVSAVYVAQTQSSQSVNIQARVSGFLDKRLYTEGAVVKAGQVLFQMDQKPFVAQVDQAKAALQRNQAAADVAKSNLARTRPLAEQNALSQKDLDDAQGQYEQAAAAVEQSKAQLTEAQLNLSYTTIRSPVSGVASYAQIADGTYLSPSNSQLTTVSWLSPMWINFSISENELERVRNDVRNGLLRMPEGGHFVVQIEMVDGQLFPYTGRITFADPSFNSATGTFLLRATVDNPAGVLRPNQYVRARLSGAVRPAAIVVPQRAVQQGAKGHFVWVIDAQNRAELRPVSVGDWYGGDGWIVTEGVAAGDLVVVDGGTRLTAGAKVASKPYVAPAPAQVHPQAASAAKPAPAGSAAAVAAVRCATGAAALDAGAVRRLREAAASLMSMGTAITITGYADARGDHAANVDLAKRRATAVRDALVTNGVDPRRLRLAAPKEVTGSGTAAEARRVDIGLAQ
jgi:membrane fusion protein (multidrug efflux system)